MASNLIFAVLLFQPQPANLVDIHCFKDTQKAQRIYTIDPQRVAQLKKLPRYENLGVLGKGSAVEGPGLKRLWCVERDGLLVYYLDAPKKLPKEAKIIKNFEVYVWTNQKKGTRAVYAASQSDLRRMVFSMDRDEIKNVIEKAESVAGLRMVDRGRYFYLIGSRIICWRVFQHCETCWFILNLTRIITIRPRSMNDFSDETNCAGPLDLHGRLQPR